MAFRKGLVLAFAVFGLLLAGCMQQQQNQPQAPTAPAATATVAPQTGMVVQQADTKPLTGGSGVPKTMTYGGTEYENCHLSPDYPATVQQSIVQISGVVQRGNYQNNYITRNHPLVNALFVQDNVLFNYKTQRTFSYLTDFSAALGKTLTLKGYYGEGLIEEYKPFYVTDVVGWYNVCCDAVGAADVSSKTACFWFKKSS